MWTVAAISFGRLTVQVSWLGLGVGGQPAFSLHSSNEPGELSQWLCHDDSTINIISVIIIIIIIMAIRPSIPPLRELTCHVGSHSFTCHPAEVAFSPLPAFTPA